MIILVLLAFVCDLLGLIPFVKDVLGTIFWIGASIYFYMIGMGFLNARRLATTAISWIASVIPGIQEIPLELVAGIIVIFIITRVEEKTGLSITSGLLSGKLHGNYAPQISQRNARTFTPLNKDGSRGPVNARVPLNQNGVRAPQQKNTAQSSSQKNNASPNQEIKPDPIREEKDRRMREGPNRDYAAGVYAKTRNEKYNEYIERGFSRESAAAGAHSDAEFAHREDRRIYGV